MSLLDRVFPFLANKAKAAPKSKPAAAAAPTLPQEPIARSSELGVRTTPENQLRYLFRLMYADPDQRQAILDIREMDRLDGRVRRIHSRIARDTIKGGLVFVQASSGNNALATMWDEFQRRLQLDRVEKIKSDVRGLVMEGSLPLQWVLDPEYNVVAAVRMPSETIIPNVNSAGRFKDVTKAYVQYEIHSGRELASFPLYQLTVARFDPDNFDDLGSLGRPFLDATRTTWRKLRMTEEDLVIRRRVRAPLRLSHVLEGASREDIAVYRAEVERDQTEITTDYYQNKKGGVSPLQGDANLDQIADISHLLDTFFAGSPLPKGMMGYTDNLARDILEDLKRDYYDEIDVIQDTMSFVYAQGFRLHLLLKGINADAEDYEIKFAERRTETPSQTTDRVLKWQAIGLPKGMIFEELGLNPEDVRQRLEDEAADVNPYPDPAHIAQPNVSVTPGNQPKGESATSISNA